MDVSLQFDVQTTVTDADAYTAQIVTTTATGIELEVFVFDVQYDAFIGVATVHGMLNYPRSKEAAIAEGASFYRAVGVTRNFTSQAGAAAFITYTRARLTRLQVEWKAYVDAFPASYTFTVPS